MSDGIPGAEMGSAERELLFEAVLTELGERGYAEVSIERALRRCQLPPEDLGGELGKDACLAAAFDRVGARWVEEASRGCEPGLTWPERVGAGLRRVLEELAARPTVARAMIRAFPAIRPDAYRRYVVLLESFVPLLEEGRGLAEEPLELPAEIEMLAIGAAETIVVGEIDAGRTAGLPALLPDILFSVLVPFVGPEAAAAAMLSAQPGA
jgi:hypothetical protein